MIDLDNFKDGNERNLSSHPTILDLIDYKDVNILLINLILKKAMHLAQEYDPDILFCFNKKILPDLPRFIFIGNQYILLRFFTYRKIQNKEIPEDLRVVYLADVKGSDNFKLMTSINNQIHWVVNLDRELSVFKPIYWFINSVKSLKKA